MIKYFFFLILACLMFLVNHTRIQCIVRVKPCGERAKKNFAMQDASNKGTAHMKSRGLLTWGVGTSPRRRTRPDTYSSPGASTTSVLGSRDCHNPS